MAWLHAAIVVFLVVVFPPLDRRFSKTASRLQMYATAMIVSWSVTIVLLATVPLRRMWYAPQLPMRAPLWLLVEIVVVVLFVAFVGRRRPSVDFLVPRTGAERVVFGAAAISAGFCEETIYRGFMIRYFEPWLGLTAAIVAAAIAFGLAHVYQGLRGAVITFLLGLILTFLFFIAGSLWLPMLVHAAADLRLLAVANVST